VGPFTFNAIRFVLGSLSLLPLVFAGRRKGRKAGQESACSPSGPAGRGAAGRALRSFLIAGSCLFAAVALQQLGIMFTTVGNSGFITGLYVVLTPLFGIPLGKKTGFPTWIGAAVTLGGLYFLSVAGRSASINPGDIITTASAVLWACHVLIIDRLVRKTDPIVLSSGQFACCGILFFAAVFTLEPFVGSWAAAAAPEYQLPPWRSFPELCTALGAGGLPGFSFREALIPLLYGGLASVGIAYTLQTVAQRDAPPAHATIILCLEGFFAALGGLLFLGEKPGAFALLGFALMLCGMLISQWDVIAGGYGKNNDPALP
jgi:drug/metabolite transporter (DMT)-like permease